MLQQGEIGEIVGCTFAGPHTLNYERRPKWYFAPGMHGGILNDLMGHGVDFVQWITRRPYAEVRLTACGRVSAFRNSPRLRPRATHFSSSRAGPRFSGMSITLRPPAIRVAGGAPSWAPKATRW